MALEDFSLKNENSIFINQLQLVEYTVVLEHILATVIIFYRQEIDYNEKIQHQASLASQTEKNQRPN